MTSGLALDQLVERRERLLFAVMVLVSLAIYAAIAVVILRDPASGAVIVFYGAILAFVGFLVHAFAIGRIRGSGVLVSVPYLGPAYSRACEYICDRVGAYCEPTGAIDGLLALAVGGWLHTHVSAQDFALQAGTDKDFWIRRAEVVSSHPRLPKRVAALMALGIAAPPAQAMPGTDGAG
jgi:Zn-dependent protease with chaperone function